MSQLCVVWLCLPNLKDTLVKGGRALELSTRTVGREEPSQWVYRPPQRPTSLGRPFTVLSRAPCVQCLEPAQKSHSILAGLGLPGLGWGGVRFFLRTDSFFLSAVAAPGG